MLEISNLTNGEKLLIWRRRCGLTQPEAALRYRLTVKRYRNWEKGRHFWDPEIDVEMPLYEREKCLLLRRRRNWRQAEVAKKMNMSREWVNMMERNEASVEPLVKFWGQYGNSTQ